MNRRTTFTRRSRSWHHQNAGDVDHLTIRISIAFTRDATFSPWMHLDRLAEEAIDDTIHHSLVAAPHHHGHTVMIGMMLRERSIRNC